MSQPGKRSLISLNKHIGEALRHDCWFTTVDFDLLIPKRDFLRKAAENLTGLRTHAIPKRLLAKIPLGREKKRRRIHQFRLFAQNLVTLPRAPSRQPHKWRWHRRAGR